MQNLKNDTYFCSKSFILLMRRSSQSENLLSCTAEYAAKKKGTFMTQENLIKYYEALLEKVKRAYGGDCRKIDYIKSVEKDLEEVRNGRDW